MFYHYGPTVLCCKIHFYKYTIRYGSSSESQPPAAGLHHIMGTLHTKSSVRSTSREMCCGFILPRLSWAELWSLPVGLGIEIILFNCGGYDLLTEKMCTGTHVNVWNLYMFEHMLNIYIEFIYIKNIKHFLRCAFLCILPCTINCKSCYCSSPIKSHKMIQVL